MPHAKTFPVELHWKALLKDLGVSAAEVLLRAGLPQDLFSRPSAGLSTEAYFRFWNSLESTTGDVLFPLRLINTMQVEVFSPALFAALCSPHLHIALQRLSRYKQLVAPMALQVTRDARGVLSASPHWLDTATPVPASLIVAELAFLLRLARLGTRENIQALAITLPTLPQPLADYAHYFGTPIQVGNTPTIRFSAQDAERLFLTANDSLWNMFEPELRRRLAELDASASFAERVQALLLENLPSGQASIETIAQRLAMSKRTLQRRLSEEGANFQTLTNRTREQLARHYLTQTRISNAEIAFLLGFEDSNSFFRAFHDWTGHTPQSVRQAQTA